MFLEHGGFEYRLDTAILAVICVIFLSRSKNSIDGISNFATSYFESFPIYF